MLLVKFARLSFFYTEPAMPVFSLDLKKNYQYYLENYVKRIDGMQRFEILTKTQLEKVHETSLRILEQIGVNFGYSPALEVLKKGGAKVDGQRVFFPPGFVEEQIKKPPAEFTLYARNPEHNVVIGGRHTVFAPGYGADRKSVV